MRLATRFMFICALSVIGAFQLAAGIININIDENGNGSYTNNGVTTPLTATFSQDPGPGGLAKVLIYSGLPLGLGFQGDLILTDGQVTMDLIRWNGSGTIAFYSDSSDGADAMADTASFPVNYTNLVSTPEVGSEGNNGVTWSPTGSQPGAGNSDFTFVYNITSDSAVPEPGTWGLMTLAVAGLFGRRALLRRRN